MRSTVRSLVLAITCAGAAGAMAAQAACNCKPQESMCSAQQLAAEKNAGNAQWASLVSLARVSAESKLNAGASTDTTESKVAYQQVRHFFGEKKLADLVGKPLAMVSTTEFEVPEFRAKVLSLREVTLRHLGINLHANTDLFLPGKPAGRVVIPRTPSRIVTVNGNSCWTPIPDPFEVKPGAAQMSGAFGSDFPEVGRIIRVVSNANTPGEVELTGVCAFVALSPRWVLTALHCVADQAVAGGVWKKGAMVNTELPTPWAGERVLFLGQSAALSTFPRACFDKQASGVCPWTQLHVEDVFHVDQNADVDAPRMPAKDIALIQLSRPISADIDYPVFTPSSSAGTSTLVAFGKVAPPFWEFFHLQVGWNRSGSGDVNTGKFTWNPSQNAGQTTVCPGDSGGAVFAGYENGGCECQKGKKVSGQRRLTGLVSFLSTDAGFSNLQPPAQLAACAASNYAGAVMPVSYKPWICGLAVSAKACQ